MAEFRAQTVVPAPIEQTFELLTYFHRYPEFFRLVARVSYYDDQNTHWVLAGEGGCEWDAVNEGWQEPSRIGWRATNGKKASAEILLQPCGKTGTNVFFRFTYDGSLAPAREVELQSDLDRFARAVADVQRSGQPLDWTALRRRRIMIERGEIADQQQRLHR